MASQPLMVTEQRTVLVTTRPRFYDEASFTYDEVQHEIAHWGRTPIDLERVRAMLVELARHIKPKPGGIEPHDLARHLRAGCVATLRTPVCDVDVVIENSVLTGAAPQLDVRATILTLGRPR